MDFQTLLVAMLVFGAITGIVAKARNRSFLAWFFISLIISPLISIIILLIMKRGEVESEYEVGEQNTFTGPADTSNDSYNIYLTKQYKIEKNEVLSKFIVGDKSFDEVQGALNYAHELDKEKSAIKKSKLNKDGSLACAKCGGSNVGNSKECRYCRHPLVI